MKTTALLMVIPLLGCSGLGPNISRSSGESGNLFIQASSHVANPWELQEVYVTVDGEQASGSDASALGRASKDTVPVASFRVRPGLHEVSVHVAAIDKTNDQLSSLTASQPLRVDSLPATVIVHVFTPRIGNGGERRVDVSFDVKGGEARAPVGAISAPLTGQARCELRSEVDGAICRAELLEEQARASRDPILLQCIRDTLHDIRNLTRIAGSGDSPNQSCSGHCDRVGRHATIVVSERLEQLERRVALCPTQEMLAGVNTTSW